VSSLVVADAGPLIGIARTGHLFLLKNLYNSISIPSRVFEELKVSSHKPGTMALSEAINAGWIKIVELNKSSDSSIFRLLIDAGEAEAIQLALEKNARLLIIDDRKGRKIAKSRGIKVIGTGGILILAKRAGILDRVSPVLNELSDAGYRLSPDLFKRIMELANEG